MFETILKNKHIWMGDKYSEDYVNIRELVSNYPEASYYMSIGARSNGKTYGALDYALEEYFKNGSEIAYVRRWDEDIRGKRGQQVFANIVRNGLVKKYSRGKWDGIRYYSGQWWLTNGSGDKLKQDIKPFAYAFSLNSMEHDKSTGYPNVRNIIFDEFLTRGFGLVDEFVIWTNVLSTIIRDPSRTDVRVFMLANTVNWDSPYFREYGIMNARNMSVGDIYEYAYGNSSMTLVLWYTLPLKVNLEANRFFAFNNPQIQMINDGSWELDLYPHCPHRYRSEDIVFNYFIVYNDDVIQGDIVNLEDGVFILYHNKTTPIKYPDKDLIFTNTYTHKRNVRSNILKPVDNISRRILSLIKSDRVFYQDNLVGETVNNYLKWCKSN